MTREDSDLLLGTTTGTAMGAMLRQYWVPAVRGAKLEADGAPARVRLFGENYVAFRATDGRVGFFDEGCPHRCTSLALARNEDNALTCIFHGWKIDVSGKVVEVPSEPPQRRVEFAAKVRVNHYPVREAAGVVWVWLGKGEQPAPFPNFSFVNLPATQVTAISGRLGCHWLQALELLLDPARTEVATALASGASSALSDNPPLIDVEARPYGYRAVAVRSQSDGSRRARISEWAFPWYTFLPEEEVSVVAGVVPVDDEQCVLWLIVANPTGPLAQAQLRALGILDRDPDNFAAATGAAELWHAAGQATVPRTPSLLDDIVLPQSQGRIQNLLKQSLCSSDEMVVKAREALLQAAREYGAGKPTLGLAGAISYEQIRAAAGNLVGNADWHSLVS
ncbi:MAG TPA: Rieske 2Fe-2S domain-containing protein [Candidatus Binataceae bacterium]|nr:Rieske 2Fe-2S domain-containing protein [Candidatus Binataceae bacterium]